MTPYYIHGTKTRCAGCGEEYIQDQPQEFLDDPIECHPDIRILCSKCMPRDAEDEYYEYANENRWKES